jgi:histidinol-phosphate aminotransferase
VIEAVRANVGAINRYPDAQCPELGDIVAEMTAVPRRRIVWGNGSEEMIKGAIQFAVNPGDGIVLPTPTFWGYLAMVKAADAELTEVPMELDGSHDVDKMNAAVGNRTKLMFCVTPNNPTGAFLSKGNFARLAAGVPSNVVLFVDEAYAEFGTRAGGPDIPRALAERDGPWVVARTFSKVYAMAGMRIGYALCSDDEVADALRKTTQVFNVPILAQAAAEAALADTEYRDQLLDRFDAERARFTAGLRVLGLDPLESCANFVSMKVPMSGRETTERMLELGVQIHAWPNPGYENFIRITLGRPDDNDACLVALKQVLAR